MYEGYEQKKKWSLLDKLWNVLKDKTDYHNTEDAIEDLIKRIEDLDNLRYLNTFLGSDDLEETILHSCLVTNHYENMCSGCDQYSEGVGYGEESTIEEVEDKLKENFYRLEEQGYLTKEAVENLKEFFSWYPIVGY